MNTLQGSFTPSKKPPKKIVANEYETLEHKKNGIIDTVAKVATAPISDMWAQIMGADKYAAKPTPAKGDMKAGQEVNLKPRSNAEAPMNYSKEIAEVGKHGSQKEAAEVRQQLQSIMYELQRLASSSKTIEKHVTAAVGTGLVSPGKYHVAFFEWMLSVIRTARKRVENAGAWLGTVKKKKGFVQGMKKNMSQLLSGERSASNSTG